MTEELLRQIDEPCRPLVLAMNRFRGIRTFESCCGHDERPFIIFFFAEKLEDLPPLLYWFSVCHSGCYGWSVEARTDCGMCPVRFVARSREKGAAAYAEAETIARKMNAWLDSQ